MKVYLIQEYYTDVVCEKTHTDKDGKPKRCGQKIHCSRRIHEITSDLKHATDFTKDKPNWSYETYQLEDSS